MIARTSLLIAAAALRDAGTDRSATLENRLLREGLLQSGAFGRSLLALAEHPAGASLLRGLERLALPGIAAHYRWRKQVIAGWTAQALAGGVRQVIVLGAGVDPMPTRLAGAHRTVTVFEIDRVEACMLKRHAIRRVAGELPANLHLVETDLSRQMPGEILQREIAFDPMAPTLVIAEGLAMYLEAATVFGCVDSLRTAVSHGTPLRLLATAMQARALRPPGFHHQSRWIDWWLKRGGEAFQWGIAREQLGDALKRCGLRLDRLADPDDDPCPGEWVFSASIESARS